MKLVKLLSNLGYGSRREVQQMIRYGAVTDDTGRALTEKEVPPHEQIRFRGAPLDPATPLTILLNKPCGYTCSTEDPEETVYDLLPARFGVRKPLLSTAGRLDKDTSGLLLLTDDGKLLHRIIHPKSACGKVYHAILDRPIEGHEAELFAAGTLLLEGETKPLLPASLTVINPNEALLTLQEGRYHQVRRMFAAAGNHVNELKRLSIGGLSLPADLAEGEWRQALPGEIEEIFR
ncbi:MAG TPA: pseudouridine synthase [Verrucomicrobiales bacterium]|jgi:16S rRNA pseudouridine516 synthase|nr:pseudouridine synthase [Verrucomicrobiales bacterium]